MVESHQNVLIGGSVGTVDGLIHRGREDIMNLTPVGLSTQGVVTQGEKESLQLPVPVNAPVAVPGEVGEIGNGGGHIAFVAVVNQAANQFLGNQQVEIYLIRLSQKLVIDVLLPRQDVLFLGLHSLIHMGSAVEVKGIQNGIGARSRVVSRLRLDGEQEAGCCRCSLLVGLEGIGFIEGHTVLCFCIDHSSHPILRQGQREEFSGVGVVGRGKEGVRACP